ncbi:hypothetical protein BG58_32935 [Caballeronia jiangsuensis]|nr:hypothetical protein BG58_32935 [Caballeronia jiangsuensis]
MHFVAELIAGEISLMERAVLGQSYSLWILEPVKNDESVSDDQCWLRSSQGHREAMIDCI